MNIYWLETCALNFYDNEIPTHIFIVVSRWSIAVLYSGNFKNFAGLFYVYYNLVDIIIKNVWREQENSVPMFRNTDFFSLTGWLRLDY